jgi:uncharacterized protein (TIGR03437 family)
MNEPHDMGSANWKAISQLVLDAIRANQDDKLILIPGDSWSSANRWVITHGPTAWIRDPANNFAYEAHQYFDRDESGTYAASYDSELARDPNLANVGRTRVSRFIDWCRSNNVRGIVDEYGIPGNDPRWATVLENFLAALDAAGMDGAYWAAGEWWGSYPLSVQPEGNFTLDRPQMPILTAHAGGGFLTAYSAASASVQRASGSSLVTIYGSGFTDQTASTPGAAYPLSLGGVTVQVTDTSGAVAPSGLLYVSPAQVNLQMPERLAPGRAKIAVFHAGTEVAAGAVQIAVPAPALFTANSAGSGLAAAQIVRVRADDTQTWEPVVRFDADQNSYTAVPIDFGLTSDRLFLVLYGTGVQGRNAAVQIGAIAAPVHYAGPQLQYAGVDQINVELPRVLAGAGQVSVKLVLDGVAANPVTIVFR